MCGVKNVRVRFNVGGIAESVDCEVRLWSAGFDFCPRTLPHLIKTWNHPSVIS